MAEANNQMDFDLFNGLQTESEVQSKSTILDPQTSCLRKLIHPPSSIPSFNGIPTNDARSQVLVQWRNPSVMRNPIISDRITNVLRPVTAADLTTFDYAILSPNGARVNGIPFVFNATTNSMEQDYNNVDTQDAYNFDNWQDDANLYRPIYKSLTSYLNATAFNDTGLVVSNQFNPNILFSGTILAMSLERPELFYRFVKDMVELDHIKIVTGKNKGDCDNFSQIPHYIRTELLRQLNASPTDQLDLDPNTSIQVVNLGEVGSNAGLPGTPVPTPSQIMNNSMRSYGGKAKEGTFNVHRLNTVSPAWLTASNTNNAEHGLYECYVYTKANDGTTHFIPLYDNSPAGPDTGAVKLLDTLWSKDMTWSWVYYQGLSLNSQTSVSTQLLIKKYYTGYEVQPTPKSAWSGMVNIAPKPDLMVMQGIMDAFYELKDSMPAKFNFWGALGSMAAQGLATFGTSLLDNMLKPKAKKEVSNETNSSKPSKVKKSAPAKDTRREKDIDRQLQALNKLLESAQIASPRRSNHPKPKSRQPAPVQPVRGNKRRGGPVRGKQNSNRRVPTARLIDF